VSHLILSSNLQLLEGLSRKTIEERIIVELSINARNEVLTHGRTINSGINVIKKMIELSRLGVTTISITFHHKEGHLIGIPREQMRDIMFQVPGPIQKVIIAGGITDISDLDYIWGFPKAVPQLGSAIWKAKIQPSQIFNRLINFDQRGLSPAIITDSTGALLA
jgi:phosphoribosylformimino-5-aminoimidazole carboxamide ribonucleotide (ProFAR) isomerase